MTVKLSANLGFLFREYPLPDAIAAANEAGFGAVECHWPYETDPAAVRAALAATGLPMLALNSGAGNRDQGEFGLSAVPGREADARRLIDQAVAYGAAIGASNVHVMAGRAEGSPARDAFIGNLRYAVAKLAPLGMNVLIEPLNRRDAPGYFLRTLDDAVALIDVIGSDRIKVMFDCYHLQIEGGDLLRRFQARASYIGHVQIAGVPGRAEPDSGEVAYERLLPALAESGYAHWIGAEYRPRQGTREGLGWMKAFA